ncbi:hypothetical protein V490_00085 [Pseudogymnoascus sp. VKM F-3557]|nr:hypothetical protein V490_00085 [Pseudogymnoascus sp. VKM F-3557]
MLRQVLSARGGLLSRARGLASFPSVRAHTGIRPADQHRAFHVFHRLRFDDDDGGSSYGTTSRGSRSSYGTTLSNSNFHDISSTSSTGLGSFKSSLPALGDESYSSPYTSPLLNSIITKRKVDTGYRSPRRNQRKESDDIDPVVLGELKSIRAGMQALETKVDTINDRIKDFNTGLRGLNDGFEDLNMKLKAVIEDIESALQRPTAASKKSRWKEYYRKWDSFRERGLPVSFWEYACYATMFATGVGTAYRIIESQNARLRAR